MRYEKVTCVQLYNLVTEILKDFTKFEIYEVYIILANGFTLENNMPNVW